MIENVPDNAPRKVVERGGGRHLTRPAKDEGEGHVLYGCTGEHACKDIDEDWSEDAGKPEPLQVRIQAASREDALWADQAPYDGCIEENATSGAVELVGLMSGADIGDGAPKSPFQDADLHDAGPQGGDCLSHEHGSWWDLHVLAQFEILGEVEALSQGDVAVGFEKHHRYRATGLDITRYELARGVR